jgi:hypothetical protein
VDLTSLAGSCEGEGLGAENKNMVFTATALTASGNEIGGWRAGWMICKFRWAVALENQYQNSILHARRVSQMLDLNR